MASESTWWSRGESSGCWGSTGSASRAACTKWIDRRSIAALAGLAPIARDSGRRSGPRSIGGGRPIVRTILYLAALQASRRSPQFIHFRERLQAAGKSVKTAIIATARKLVVTLNAMLASGTDYRPTAAI